MTEEKTPEQLADDEINKQIGKALAIRKLEIRKLKSQIKELEKEIEKIKTGELVPDEDYNSPSDSQPTTIWYGLPYTTYKEKKSKKHTYDTYNVWYSNNSSSTTSYSWNG